MGRMGEMPAPAVDEMMLSGRAGLPTCARGNAPAGTHVGDGREIYPDSDQVVVIAGEDDPRLDEMIALSDKVHCIRIRTGSDCRESLRKTKVDAVIVTQQVRDVSPLNLIAALGSDMRRDVTAGCPLVYVAPSAPSGSLRSRASAAGAMATATHEDIPFLLRAVTKEQVGVMATSRTDGKAAAPSLGTGSDATRSPESGAISGKEPAVAAATGASGQGASSETTSSRAASNPVMPVLESPARPAAVIEMHHEGRGAFEQDVRSGHPQLGQKTVRRGKVISFMSGNGGVGRTTLAVVAAMLLDKRGLDVAIVDFDVQFGDIAQLLGRDDVPRLDLFINAAGNRDVLIDRLRSTGTAVLGDAELFAAPCRPEAGDSLVPVTPAIIEGIASLYDVVIVDTGSFWNEINAELLRMSDRCVAVCDQRSSSLAMTAVVLDLCVRLGVPLARTDVLLNRCTPKSPIDEMHAQMTLSVPNVASIGEGDGEVDELMGLGCPEDLVLLKNPIIRSMDRYLDGLAQTMGFPASGKREGDERPRTQKVIGFFRRGGRS